MGVAIVAWLLGPTALEADLLPKADIGDWHRGTLSSRRLLALIEHLPETSAYRLALSETGWTDATQIAAEHANEFAKYRASLYVGTDHEYAPMVFLSPRDRQSHHVAAQEQSALEDEARAELMSQGF